MLAASNVKQFLISLKVNKFSLTNLQIFLCVCQISGEHTALDQNISVTWLIDWLFMLIFRVAARLHFDVGLSGYSFLSVLCKWWQEVQRHFDRNNIKLKTIIIDQDRRKTIIGWIGRKQSWSTLFHKVLYYCKAHAPLRLMLTLYQMCVKLFLLFAAGWLLGTHLLDNSSWSKLETSIGNSERITVINFTIQKHIDHWFDIK